MDPRLRIVIPFYNEFEAVKPGLRELTERGFLADVMPVQGPCVHNNRNLGINGGASQATWQTPAKGYSHFLFIDSDISFGMMHLEAALKADAPVVTLPYLGHEADGTYQVGEMNMDYHIVKKYSQDERGQRHVTYTGAGFLLVKAEVFPMLRFPWFHHSFITLGDESFSVGEDLVFCRKLMNAGFPILCDFDYPVGHRLRKLEHFDVSF